MSDGRKEIIPTRVDPSPVGRLTAVDLAKIDRVPPELMPQQPTVIYVQSEAPPPAQYRGDEILRRFVPYFVITMMGLVILGGIAAILGMVIPMILAAILAVVASFVSIVLSLVATIISGVVIALGIAYCQTINAKQGGKSDHDRKFGRGR
jgi:hypothetical protein